MKHLPSLTRFLAVLALALVVATPLPAFAHPHSFMEVFVTIVFDENGLAGLQQKWVIDEMTALTVLEATEENMDGKLTKKEVAAIKELSMGSLKDYGYFNDIRIDGKSFKPPWIKDFTATLDGGKLIYDFFLPCHVKAAKTAKNIVIGIYDQSFYVFISLGRDGGKSIDPTKDPKFMDRTAGPNPDDFERFSEAVGLEAYQGNVNIQGPLEKFAIKAEVREAPEMSYFEGQISPEAFVISFQAR